jgi:acyl-coenzyme A synthetase/AMP-(fatty) acid ligase
MAVAADARTRVDAPVPTQDAVGAIPRRYNFAADILDRNLKAGRASKPAFIDPRGTWTYGALADRVARFAAVLRTLGVRREERVLIALLDTIDWPTAFLGCLKAGVVAVPVNTLMTEDDYRFMLADSRARALVVSEALYPRFQKLIGESDALEHVIVSGDNAHSASETRINAPMTHKRFEDLIEGSMPEAQTAPTVRDDIAFWLYTSGSTGKPKGAVHVHADLKLTDDLYGGPFLEITENDVCYSVAKLFLPMVSAMH